MQLRLPGVVGEATCRYSKSKRWWEGLQEFKNRFKKGNNIIENRGWQISIGPVWPKLSRVHVKPSTTVVGSANARDAFKKKKSEPFRGFTYSLWKELSGLYSTWKPGRSYSQLSCLPSEQNQYVGCSPTETRTEMEFSMLPVTGVRTFPRCPCELSQ